MKIYKVPLVIRGEVIEDYELEYAGRQGGISFQTPDVNKYMKQLVTSAGALNDLYSVSLDEIVDFIVEVGKRINLETNTHLQEAYEIPEVFRGTRLNPVFSVGYEGSGISTHRHDANFQSQVPVLQKALVFTKKFFTF